MMTLPFDNDTRAIVKKLTRRSLKADKKRNFFIVMAIMLTTLLIGSAFSIGMSILETVKMEQLRIVGTTTQAALGRPTAAQLTQLRQLPYIKSVGTYYQVADVKSKPQLGGAYLALHYFDKTDWEQMRTPAYTDIVGHYPQAEDEVMASRGVLNLLGIHDPVAGMEIPLSYTAVGEEKAENKTFRLSGWYTSYSMMNGTDSFLVSEVFAQRFQKSREEYFAADIIFTDENQISESFERMKTDIGVTEEQPAVLAKPNEKGNNAQAPILLALGAIAMFFILIGYLLIYNVLYISVSRDVRFYGLLKTIGATPKQIKRIVVKQILCLCLIGIPIGVAAAFLFSVLAIPAAIGTLKIVSTGAVVSFSPLIYLAAAAFALCTALFGASLPAKKAANVSPIEAQKFTGIGKQRVRRPARGKPYAMAIRNVFRNRKRAVVVLLSLFLGLTTFTAVTTIAYSMGIDKYIDSVYPNDFVLTDQTLVVGSAAQQEQTFDDRFMGQAATLPGLESCTTLMQEYMQLGYSQEEFGEHATNRLKALNDGKGTFTEADIRKSFIGFLVGMDSADLRKLEGADQQLDYSAFDRGEIALIATAKPEWFSNVSPIKITPMEVSGGGNAVKTLGAEVQIPFGGFAPASLELSGSIAPTVVVSKAVLNRLYPNPALREIRLNVASGSEKQALEVIKQISGDNPDIRRISKIEAASVLVNAQTVLLALGGGIALVIALIGVLNFINIMSVSVMVRKRELATLESIGMSRKQIRKMLIGEGLCYAVITLVLVLSVGNAITYGIFELFRQQVSYAVFTYPYIPVAITMMVVLAVCLITPERIYRSVNKATIVERLREAE